MSQEDCSLPETFTKELVALHQSYLKQGLTQKDYESVLFLRKERKIKNNVRIILHISLIILLISLVLYKSNALNFVLGIRCVVPNNYFIWEATRPLSDCSFCSNVDKPIELHNVTREMFKPYAYSSKPIIVRNAFSHWPAKEKFNWQYFKDLYEGIEDSYKSVDEECQFLHFKSDFISVKDVFAMSDARVKNFPGEKSWYVGWGNCHPTVLQEMRKYYPKPHFLPDDAEIPHKDYVFMGYDDGATMHLDFINRLMWQAQLQGSKVWKLLPPPECQSICRAMTFKVYPGDGVLVDTRVWYHATTIPDGQFSLSIQSEYG